MLGTGSRHSGREIITKGDAMIAVGGVIFFQVRDAAAATGVWRGGEGESGIVIEQGKPLFRERQRELSESTASASKPI
jgi:hypothetical protein